MDISDAALAWIEQGRSLYSMMFTFPHERFMALRDMWTMMSESFRALLTGRPWIRLKNRFDIAGFVRSTEATHGLNGWHPHIHILLFLESECAGSDLTKLQDAIYERWASQVMEAGYGVPKRRLFEIHPVRSASAVCDYLVKSGFFEEDLDFAVQIERRSNGTSKMRHVGLELARSDLKAGRRTGRTPFQIIGDYCEDPDRRKRDLRLWYTWEEESKGKRSVEWSRGYDLPDGTRSRKSFKNLFGLKDETDEEMADKDVGAAKLMHLSNGQFEIIRVSGRVLDALEIMEMHGEEGGSFYVDYLVRAFRETGDLTALEDLERILRNAEPTESDVQEDVRFLRNGGTK